MHTYGSINGHVQVCVCARTQSAIQFKVVHYAFLFCPCHVDLLKGRY